MSDPGMKRELRLALAAVAVVVALAAAGPWLVRELRSLPNRSELAARGDQHVVTLEVGGMTCSGCAAKIQTTLAAIPGVSAAKVRLTQRRAYVVCGAGVADSALVGAVGRAGPGYLAAVAHD